MADKVVTCESRLSFVHVFEPRLDEQRNARKYSVQVLVPKTPEGERTMSALRALETAAKERGKANPKIFGGTIPGNLKSVIRDGDLEDTGSYPERAGHWMFNANANEDFPPTVVDRNRQPILDRMEVYSGCYGRVAVQMYPYNFQGTKGIGMGLVAVQKTRDGDPLGGVPVKVDPEDLFDELPAENRDAFADLM